MRLAIAIGLLAALIGALGGTAAAHSATYSCSLTVPKVWAGDVPGEVYTGHVKGSCNFKWYVRTGIEYKDRWHVLGTNWHGPFAANTAVVVDSDEETYAPECGYWRERITVFDANGNQRYAANGPVTEFCS